LLVEQLSFQKTTQFVLLLERRKGDAVKEIAEYWGNGSIDEVYNRVETWKAQQQSLSLQ
jgi:hypothetical protein